MINQNEILHATHNGLHIYSHILSKFYDDIDLFTLIGEECSLTLNPYNENKQTLKISNPGEMFCYQDTENAEFKGNVFDFAALYYNLYGEELLEKINHDLQLHIGKKKSFYGDYIAIETMPITEFALAHFSFYKSPISNTKPFSIINLFELYKMIKGDTYKARTLKLREISDPGEAGIFKKNSFDYVTISGQFLKRGDSSLLRHSELMTFDFDHVPSIPILKKILLGEPAFLTELMFISPSGNGLKWIISIDITLASHQLWFAAVADTLRAGWGLEVDKSGKDVSRACFIPYDPDVYINPEYIQDSDD